MLDVPPRVREVLQKKVSRGEGSDERRGVTNEILAVLLCVGGDFVSNALDGFLRDRSALRLAR